MAFEVKYRHEFYDRLGLKWRTDILADGWAGAITTLTGSSNPIEFEFMADDDIFEQNIMGSKFTLSFWASENFTFANLSTSAFLELKVNVYYGDSHTLFWTGYVLPDSYQEPYDHLPIMVKLACSDGLGILKEFEFVDFEYTERTKMAEIIYDILANVGITTFTEYLNLYSTANMDTTVDDSPLDQTGIEPELYEEKTCYEALESILRFYNGGIRQDLGEFKLYRFKEVEGDTMYGRIFTSATTKSSTTFTPTQYLKRQGQSSNLWDKDGGTLMLKAKAKEYILNYDMGWKYSILKNWDFDYDDWVYGYASTGLWGIPHWQPKWGNAGLFPMSEKLPGERKGVFFNVGGAPGNYQYAQTVDLKSRSSAFKYKFEYRHYNSAATTKTGRVRYCLYLVLADTSRKVWKGPVDGWAVWPSPYAMPNTWIEDAYSLDAFEWSDWKTADFVIASIPDDGTLHCLLLPTEDTSHEVKTCYRNVQLQMNAAESDDKDGLAYNVIISTVGKVIEKEFDLGCGHELVRKTVNQLINYKGIVNLYDSGDDFLDPGISWFTRGNTENVAVSELICDELAGQYSRQKHVIDLPLIEMDKDTHLSLIGNLIDVDNVYNSTGRCLAIGRATFTPRSREWKLTVSEIL